MPLHGGPVEQLTHDPRPEFASGWAPNGRAMTYGAFSTQLDSSAVFILLRAASGNGWGTPRRLDEFRMGPDACFPPFVTSDYDLTTDGSRLYLRRIEHDSDIGMAALVR